MESWRQTWRDGFAPVLTDDQLSALAAGLESDDTCLIQGATTHPAALMACLDWPCEGGCAIGYAAMRSPRRDCGDAATVGDVANEFGDVCRDAGDRLGDPSAVRYFLNWFDDTDRVEMRQLLLPEVWREISRRYAASRQGAGIEAAPAGEAPF